MKGATNVRLLRIQEVLTIIPVSKTAWWIGVRSGIYPKPYRLGVRSTVWSSEDIQQLVMDTIDGGNDE